MQHVLDHGILQSAGCGLWGVSQCGLLSLVKKKKEQATQTPLFTTYYRAIPHFTLNSFPGKWCTGYTTY